MIFSLVASSAARATPSSAGRETNPLDRRGL